MKNLVLFISFLLVPFISILPQEKTFTYVGVQTCGTCHKAEKQGNQLAIWQASKHAGAYNTLKTDKANEIAKSLGHTTLAVETEACLKCHATGYNLDASLKGEKFKVEDGVQCETCHGAGSEYKNLKIMKNKADAIANGLVMHENKEEFCVSCHNPESPTFVEFKLDSMWEKIKHPKPQM